MSILSRPTLVLNRAWICIGTTPVKEAICDIMRGAAKGVCTESFQMYDWEQWVADENPPVVLSTLKTSGKDVPAPEVIVLTRYDKLHKKTLYLGGKTLYIRDEYTCRYCKQRKRGKDLSIDHIYPKSRGGPNTWENCVTACLACNQRKADRTPKEAGMPPVIPVPKKPKWSPIGHISPQARLESWNTLIHQGH